jgi:hypothetical protein
VPSPKSKIVKQPTVETSAKEPRYKKPKILLIDTDPEVGERLISMGLNVQEGSFGKRYKVQRSSDFFPLLVSADLPNVSEQEIVVIDLLNREPTDRPQGEKLVPHTEWDWWVKGSNGVIDPRPRGAATACGDFNTILQSGGIFIVFASWLVKQEIRRCCQDLNGMLVGDQLVDYNPWSFLDTLKYVPKTNILGEEMFLAGTSELAKLLFPFLEGSEYECTFSGLTQDSILATNKYGSAVAAQINFDPFRGHLIILPQLADKAGFIQKLISEFLPTLGVTPLNGQV